MAENHEVYDVTIIGGAPDRPVCGFLLRDAGAENESDRVFTAARREGVYVFP